MQPLSKSLSESGFIPAQKTAAPLLARPLMVRQPQNEMVTSDEEERFPLLP